MLLALQGTQPFLPLLGSWLELDGLSTIVVYLSLGSFLVLVWASIGSGQGADSFVLGLLFSISVIALVSVSNMLAFYVAWEIVGLSCWGLGKWGVGLRSRLTGALPFNAAGALASLCMFVAVMLLAWENRTLEMKTLKLPDSELVPALLLGAVLLKSFGILGHAWHPADGRSFSVSQAILASGGLAAVGLYPYLRFFHYVLVMPDSTEWSETTFFVALGLALVMGVAALGEVDSHRLLTLGSFGQFSWVIALLSLRGDRLADGAVLGGLTYALSYAGLFLCLGIVESATGKRVLRVEGGALRSMPLVAVLFWLLATSAVGLPPLGGFVSALLVTDELSDTGRIVMVFSLAAMALVSFLYLLRLFAGLFLGKQLASVAPRGAFFSVVAVLVLVGGLGWVSLYPGAVLEWVQFLHLKG